MASCSINLLAGTLAARNRPVMEPVEVFDSYLAYQVGIWKLHWESQAGLNMLVPRNAMLVPCDVILQVARADLW